MICQLDCFGMCVFCKDALIHPLLCLSPLTQIFAASLMLLMSPKALWSMRKCRYLTVLQNREYDNPVHSLRVRSHNFILGLPLKDNSYFFIEGTIRPEGHYIPCCLPPTDGVSLDKS